MRSSVSIDILELSEDGLETVATWKRDSPIDTDRITSKRRYKEPKSNPIDDYSLRNKTLIVITALVNTIQFHRNLNKIFYFAIYF